MNINEVSEYRCECRGLHFGGCSHDHCEGTNEEWEELRAKATDRNSQSILRKLCPEFINKTYSKLLFESEHLALVED